MPFTEIDYFEENPDIILLFHGLMAVWEDPEQKHLAFGCHGAPDKPHQLQVQMGVYTWKDFKIESIIKSFDPKTNFEFYIEGDDENSNVGVYKNKNNPLSKRNFNNVINMEKLHGTDIWEEKPNFSHLITVKKGVLYTKEYTESTFDLYNNSNYEFSDKQVASELGINISLSDNQTGVLRLGNQIINFEKREGSPQIIRFTNECNYNWKPQNSHETERNDFYLNYDNLIDTTKIDSKYGLYLKTPGNRLISTFGQVSDKTAAFDKSGQTSRDSPCTAQGYPTRRD